MSPEYLKGRAAKNAASAEKPATKPANKEVKKKPPAITYPESSKVSSHYLFIISKFSFHNTLITLLLTRSFKVTPPHILSKDFPQ